MSTEMTIPTSSDPSVAKAAATLLREHQLSNWKRIDHLLAGLLAFEWIGVMLLAGLRSPFTWEGVDWHIHPHLYAAVFLGGAIVSLPIALAVFNTGTVITRHTIAIAQMLMSGLLIHVGDGRIEMHFHIFGSLAFLAFYRDWRVLVTATVVTALDHLMRGIYMPLSVYGVLWASLWRTAEHAGWVLFEDIFLIGSCIQGVREMRGIAQNRALLEHSYRDVEMKIQERTAQLKTAQDDLLKAARTAGMAEIATSVLHNVGNVLNSVNVSATIVADKLRQSEIPSLGKISEMIIEHKPDLAGFLTTDQRGKLIPDFITELAACLGQEQTAMLDEVVNLSKGIDHIKQIVAAQQSMAKKSNLQSAAKPESLLESALSMQGIALAPEVEIRREYSDCTLAMLDSHKVLQILINLISNARQAVQAKPPGKRCVTLRMETVTTADGDRLRYQVVDNGMGIAEENLSRIFSHGFTTKSEGHGFGLHSAANAAREMAGSLTATSEGRNKGAIFTLEIPFISVAEGASCKL